MIIYRTSGNYNKGIKEFEIENVIDDKTFQYKIKDRLVTGTFTPEFGEHQPRFFLTYEEAKKHLTNRIKEKIKKYETQLKKAIESLNTL